MDQALAVPEHRPHGADGVRGPEGAPEEPDGVEVLEPLAILDISLPARDVLDVAGVHQADLEASGLQELEQRDPVHAGRFHRHRGDADLLQPGRQGEELAVARDGGFIAFHMVQGGYYVKGFAKHGPLHNPYTYGYLDHVPYKNFKGGHVTCGGIIIVLSISQKSTSRPRHKCPPT